MNEYTHKSFSELEETLTSIIMHKGSSNDFFARFGLSGQIYNYLLDVEKYSTSFKQMLEFLFFYSNKHPSLYAEMHKGTAFYWLGASSYICLDFQSALFYMDAATSEDIRIPDNFVDKTNSNRICLQRTPATSFFLLDKKEPYQTARPLTINAANYVIKYLTKYNRKIHQLGLSLVFRNLTLNRLRSKLLAPSLSKPFENWRTLSSSLITYILDLEYHLIQLSIVPQQGTLEPYYLHLIKGTVLLESLLRHNLVNPFSQEELEQKTLYNSLVHCHKELGIGSSFSGKSTFEQILNKLADIQDSLQAFYELSLQVRNSIQHSIAWDTKISRLQYQKIAETIIITCLHCINCLYREQKFIVYDPKLYS